MSRTYKAVQATQPGKLEVVERAIIEPAFGQVRIRVEACGVCHSDALAVEGGFPGLNYPRVPGHEVIGKIEAIGPGVKGWKVGQRGLGHLGMAQPSPLRTAHQPRRPEILCRLAHHAKEICWTANGTPPLAILRRRR